MGERLQALLLFANEVQVALDEAQPEVIPQLCGLYGEEFPLLAPDALPDRREALDAGLDLLERLEILSEDWKALLSRGRELLAEGKDYPAPEEARLRRAGSYFLYRHWLRGVWDGDVLTWAELAALGAAVCALLAPLREEGFPEVFRLFCLEIEHDRDNLNALQDAFQKELSLAQVLSAAGLA